MITIQSLEVRFDVEGSDEEVFARLFEKFIRSWSELDDERRALERQGECERQLGDRPEAV
jgi:hypothetical protein